MDYIQSGNRAYAPLPDDNGGGDFMLVFMDEYDKPRCGEHGAMNKVSEHGYWRCIALSGPKKNPCRAGCQEVEPWTDPEDV